MTSQPSGSSELQWLVGYIDRSISAVEVRLCREINAVTIELHNAMDRAATQRAMDTQERRNDLERVQSSRWSRRNITIAIAALSIQGLADLASLFHNAISLHLH